MNLAEEEIEGSLIGLAHDLVRSAVKPGDIAVDATVGNGHDMLFLAHCVRSEGKVFGFDVQDQAIKATRERLIHDGVPEEVFELHATGHEQLGSFVPLGASAVMFNLGYLPGSDKSMITLTQTTLEALDQACVCLKAGGLLCVMCYPGHEGGDREANEVVHWFERSKGNLKSVTRYQRAGARGSSPFLMVAEKAPEIG